MSDHTHSAPGLELPSDIVYVRELRPEEAQALPPGTTADEEGEPRRLFAIHDAEGARLALTDDRDLAFALARQHDKQPLSVH